MKSLWKCGLIVAMGLATHRLGGQELQWRASAPMSSNPVVAGTPPQSSKGGDAGVRPVSLSQPVKLGADPLARGQSPDPIIVQPLPKVEPGVKPLPKGTPGTLEAKPLPIIDGPKKDGGFTPPPPTEIPSPIFESLGLDCDDSCLGDGCLPRRGCRGLWGPNRGFCPDRPRCWINAEYLMWWQKGQDLPPLVTSSPAGTPPAQIGVLPNATILYDSVPTHTHSGGRISGGMWFNRFCNLGIDTTFFWLGQLNTAQSFTSDGTRFLARPFFDTRGFQNSEPFASGTRTGSALIETYNQLWGMDVNLRRSLYCSPNCWLDFLAGYRHVSLREGISITEDLLVTTNEGPPSNAQAGQRFVERESFDTRNIFHGGQIGIQGEYRFWNRWSLGVTSKVAFGTVTQIITIDGSTTFSQGNTTTTQVGALLATQTNIGRYQQTRYAVSPEVSFKLGYDITDNVRVFVGYDFLYISNVVRPGEQIDTVVNQSFRPTVLGGGAGTGERRPAVLFRTSDYWAQGLSMGLLCKY